MLQYTYAAPPFGKIPHTEPYFFDLFGRNNKSEKISKNFQKSIDKTKQIVYNIEVVERQTTREWRNWQTRTFEGRVVYTVRVQVPFSAPKKASRHLP